LQRAIAKIDDFLAELETIYSKVLAASMGFDEPPEKPILKPFEEGLWILHRCNGHSYLKQLIIIACAFKLVST
jgi:hypothetical protein